MKISKKKLQELIRNKLLEQPEVAPTPTEVPTKPGPPEKRPNPLRPPKEAPKPAPKGSKEEEDLIKKITDKYLKESEKTSKYSLVEMLSEIQIDDIKNKFVGDRVGGPDGKVVTPKEFDEIMKATKNKVALAIWMIKRIEQDFILPEDIYKWEEYFDTFRRKKNQFPIKDINQIKTEDDIDEFVNKAIELAADSKLAVSYELLGKYKDLHIGKVNGYEVFKIPQNDPDKEGEEFYFKASCELGEKTEWCTAGGRNMYNRYIKQGPLYIFIDPKTGDKYQFHYESNQFMDANDRSILSRF